MDPLVVFDPIYLQHVQHPGHPESPQRLEAMRSRLEELGLWVPTTPSEPASLQQLEMVHDRRYLSALAARPAGPLDGDTYLHAHTFAHARMAAGGALRALSDARVDRPALGLLRPPGHHARPGAAMGFCYLNNIAVAAAAVTAQGRRVAIVDLDLHHGNGTQEIFWERPDVLFLSTHEEGNYPGTGGSDEVGAGDGQGATLNIPLPAGSGDGTFAAAMDQVILPTLTDFAPAVVLVSLGTDAHGRDPLGRLALSSAGLVGLVRSLHELCAQRLEAPLVLLLEGGYDLQAGADCIGGIAGLLAGERVQLRFSTPTDRACVGGDWVRTARQVAEHHRPALRA